MINKVWNTFARRNWPFGKILVSDVLEAFALNPRLQLPTTVYSALQRLTPI